MKMTSSEGTTPAPKPSEFKNASRIQESLSAGAERRALLWLAKHMPSWVNSDHLTILGFVSMLLVGAGYAFARWNQAGLMLATFFLALNWFGDSLDGTLARVRNCQRPRYGFYVDHIVDSFGALFLMTGLGISGYADWRIAMGMLVAFLMLSIEVYLAVYTIGAFHLSFWKFGPTELRILLAMANTALWFRGNFRVPGTHHSLFDVGGTVGIVGMGAMLVFATITHTRGLYREETHRST